MLVHSRLISSKPRDVKCKYCRSLAEPVRVVRGLVIGEFCPSTATFVILTPRKGWQKTTFFGGTPLRAAQMTPDPKAPPFKGPLDMCQREHASPCGGTCSHLNRANHLLQHLQNVFNLLLFRLTLCTTLLQLSHWFKGPGSANNRLPVAPSFVQLLQRAQPKAIGAPKGMRQMRDKSIQCQTSIISLILERPNSWLPSVHFATVGSNSDTFAHFRGYHTSWAPLAAWWCSGTNWFNPDIS